MSCYFYFVSLDLSCGECDVISLYLCVTLLMDLFVCGCYFVVECYGSV